MAAFLFPVLIIPPTRIYPAPLFPLLRASLEDPRRSSFVAIFIVGLLAGFLTRLPIKVIGLAAMTLFPIAAFADIAKDGTSHNLIPFEIVVYLLYSIVPLLGGLTGRSLRQLMALGK